MKRALCALFVLSLALAVRAEEPASADPEARALLDEAIAAANAVRSVRLSAEIMPTGAAVNFMPASEGTSVKVGWRRSLPAKFLSRVSTWKPGSDEKTELTGGGDGDTYFLIDHVTKKAYADMDPLVMGSGGYTLQTLGMNDFVSDTPFENEQKARELELEGEEEIDGEPCLKLRAVYGDGQEAVWYFSKADKLPRKSVYFFSGAMGEGSYSNTITKLEIDPEVDADLFTFQLPGGYEQIDDFAP